MISETYLSLYTGKVVSSISIRTGYFTSKEKVTINLNSGSKIVITPTHSVPLSCSVSFKESINRTLTLPLDKFLTEKNYYAVQSRFGRGSLDESDFIIVDRFKISDFSLSRQPNNVIKTIFIHGAVDYGNNSIGAFTFDDVVVRGKQEVSIQFSIDTLSLPLSILRMKDEMGLSIS